MGIRNFLHNLFIADHRPDDVYFLPLTVKRWRNRPTHYNGTPVRWWLGDAIPDYKGYNGDMSLCRKWEAWASANGNPYQLNAIWDRETEELSNVTVLSDKTNPYFHQETYDLLTKKP